METQATVFIAVDVVTIGETLTRYCAIEIEIDPWCVPHISEFQEAVSGFFGRYHNSSAKIDRARGNLIDNYQIPQSTLPYYMTLFEYKKSRRIYLDSLL
jgi:hypothetical protein